MTPRIFLTIVAIIFAVSGLGFLLVPGECLNTLGITPDVGGLVAGRIAGQGFFGLAVAFWYARNADMSASMSPAVKGVLYGGCLFNILGVIVAAWAAIAGQIGPAGWAVAAVHLVLAAGFIYFAELKPAAARP
jgi:hypothetical protein